MQTAKETVTKKEKSQQMRMPSAPGIGRSKIDHAAIKLQFAGLVDLIVSIIEYANTLLEKANNSANQRKHVIM